MIGILNGTVARVTFRQMFTRSRIVVGAVVAITPMVIVFLYESSFRGPDATRAMLFGKFVVGMYRDLVMGTLLPLIALVFGTAAFGSEVGDGTIVYLLVKPEPRWRVVLTKLVVAAAAIALVMVPATYLPWLLVNHETMPISVPTIFSAGIVLAAALYGGLFLSFGLTSKRALVYGLIYVILVEFTLSRSLAGAKAFSVRELVLTATAKIGEGNRWVGPGDVSMDTVWVMVPLILAGAMAYAWHKYRTYELAEKL